MNSNNRKNKSFYFINLKNYKISNDIKIRENNRFNDNYSLRRPENDTKSNINDKEINENENAKNNENNKHDDKNKSLETSEKGKISFKDIFTYLKPYIKQAKPLIFYSIGLTIISKACISMVNITNKINIIIIIAKFFYLNLYFHHMFSFIF